MRDDDNYRWRMRFGGFRVSERELFEGHGLTLRKTLDGRGWGVVEFSGRVTVFRLRREAVAYARATAAADALLMIGPPPDQWPDEMADAYFAAVDARTAAASQSVRVEAWWAA